MLLHPTRRWLLALVNKKEGRWEFDLSIWRDPVRIATINYNISAEEPV